MAKRALIIVDVQNDFLPGGSLAVPEGDAILPKINELVKKPFDLIVATQDFHPKNHCSFASRWKKKVGTRIKLGGQEQILWPDHCVQGTYGASFSNELDATHFQHIVHKGMDEMVDSYSTFFDNEENKSTGLENILKTKGITELYFAGLATDYCVLYSVRDARRLGFDCYVILDACRGIDLKPGDIERAIVEMQNLGAKIIRTKEV